MTERSIWLEDIILDLEYLRAMQRAFVPAPMAGEGAVRRRAHEDLPGLSDLELWREEKRAEWLIAWLEMPDEWVEERYKRVVQEKARRKAARP